MRPSTALRAGDVRPNTLIRRSLVAAACFTAAAVLFTGEVRADYWYVGRQLSWGRALAVSLVDWEIWTLLAPALLALAARVPVTRPRLNLALLVHVPAALVIAIVKVVAEGFLVRAVLGGGTLVLGVGKLYMAVLIYGALVAAVQFAEQRRRAHERERRAAHLEAELARARLDALRMQLHPHFLFNTLNAVSGLMREDVEAADLMLTQLCELLRTTLSNDVRDQVPLSEEVDWIRTYLAIQQTRFGLRFQAAVEIGDGCEGALVPPLILQPLVENAIRHGFAVTPGPGAVSIRARRSDSRLRIDVEDEGPGVAEPVREGYGLRNTRSRLQALYGESAGLAVRARTGAPGTCSRLDLPFVATTST